MGLPFRTEFQGDYVHTVQIVKWSIAESVPDRASVHTRNDAFKAVPAPEQDCSALLLKVEHSISVRFLNF